MLRTLPRVASLFVVIGLMLTSIMPVANASLVPIAPQTDRSTTQPIVLQATQTSTHTIHLKSGDVTPGAPDLAALNQLARSDSANGRIHILLQLDLIPRDTAKAAYAQDGVQLLAYVPDYAWIASVPASDPAAALSLPGVTWAGPLTVNDKLDPMIRSGEWGSWNRTPDGTTAVSVVIHQDESIETGRALVEKHGGKIVGEVIGIRTLLVEMPQANINALAAEDAIQWIEAAQPALRETNDGIRTQIGVNTVQAAPYNLNGSGVDILIYDGGIVTATHPDFAGRITVPDSAPLSDHSTHVAGTAAGSGSLSAANGGSALQWRGMAPGADIISYGYEWNTVGMLFYNNPGDIEVDWAAAQNTYGADVGNASLGSNIYANYQFSCTLMGNYGVTEVLMDQIIRGGNAVVGVGDKYIATWANGNERGSASSCGTYSTIAPPAGAKNPIQVGASNTNDSSMAAFSSWGPTDDGRIKPIVVAGGEQIGGDGGIKSTVPNAFINNTTRNCDGSGDDYCYPYDVMQGTSMASPAVAGSLALMLQQYRTTYATTGNFWPSTAKALLMQTADDRGNAGPDYQWGYGQVRIQQAVDLIRRRGLVQASVAQGETDLYTFVVTDTAVPAQVSLAWDDFEATFNANPALINNLDLQLIMPSGVITRPWILDPANPANPATRGVNNRDNQEQVTVLTPEKGTWLVRVIGTTVPQGPQDYSLACESCRPVNAGVCQATIDNTPLLAAAPLMLNSEGDEVVLQGPPEPSAAVSAGERWQRDQEQGRSGAAQLAANFTSQEDLPYTPIDPSRPTDPDRAKADRLNVALREFDVARNAGPEAIIAFADQSEGEVRAIIEFEVVEAQEQIAARNNPIAYQIPTVPNAGRVGVNGACAYNTVQEGIDAATNGQTVRVAGDFFAGNIDVSGKNITIEGGYNATCTAIVTGTVSRLDGVAAGSVVDVSGGSLLTLKNLKLGWGSSFGAGLDVLGSSHVTLDNTDLVHNNGASGGGLYVGGGSQVTLTNGSLVQYNTGSAGGGAIVYGRLNALDNTSDITGNCSTTDGGGTYVSGGTLYLSNADMHANQALGATGRGGAIFASGDAVITMTASTFIGESAPCCNTAYDGGGIYASHSHIYSLGGNSTILQNQASNNGGGVYLFDHSVMKTASGTNIGYDVQAGNGNSAILGAGLYVDTSQLDFVGRIINNDASNSGGGMYANASVITLTNATVGGTGANQPNSIGATGLNGGGLYLFNNTHATLSNTVITSNTLTNASTGYGGGAYVRQGSVLTATNSRIERHALPSAFDGRGAGLYLYDATVTLSNTQVQTNTTPNLGAGVRMFGTSVLDVLGGSAFNNNQASGGVGGAIAATNAPDINVNNATFQNNSASTHGGAIYLDDGTLDATGWWDFRFNSAGGNGGAVAVVNTADADFVAGGNQASLLAVNVAGGDGGALYIANNDTVQLYATGGQTLNLNTNQAGGDGGAAYADAGAFFDVYGQLSATSNIAGGNGGVFYLGGGSRVWLDDYFSTRPQILVNQADNGGAIYASDSPRVECDGVDFGFSNNGNKATAGSGGAIYLSGSAFTADNCTFRNNQAQAGNGGAIAAYTSTVNIDTDYPVARNAQIQNPIGVADRSGPDAPQSTACNPDATQCSQFTSNRAISSTVSNGNGGAIYNNASTLQVNNTYLHRNEAVRGGAIYQENAAARGWLSNTLVYSNTSLVSFGAGIRNGGGAMTLTHVTAANNVGGAGFSPGSAQSYVYNTIIWGNDVGAFGALTASSCNIDQGGTAGPATNPLFIAAGAGEDYHLSLSSPARDACTSGLPRDLDNTARPYSAQFDIGAYEGHLHFVYLPLTMK
jgi:predicted outer membrane repeat protein